MIFPSGIRFAFYKIGDYQPFICLDLFRLATEIACAFRVPPTSEEQKFKKKKVLTKRKFSAYSDISKKQDCLGKLIYISFWSNIIYKVNVINAKFAFISTARLRVPFFKAVVSGLSHC